MVPRPRRGLRSPRRLSPVRALATFPPSGPIDRDYAATLAEIATTIHYPRIRPHSRTTLPADHRPAPSTSADPTGYGDHTASPPGALTYTPSTPALSNDAWCRYPNCSKPLHLCDLDHWQPFEPHQPRSRRQDGTRQPDLTMPGRSPTHIPRRMGADALSRSQGAMAEPTDGAGDCHLSAVAISSSVGWNQLSCNRSRGPATGVPDTSTIGGTP